MNNVLVIAEAGVNHNGNIDMALRLVAEAARSGADLIKFQSFITDKSISRSAPKADYQLSSTSVEESQYDMVHRLELSPAEHEMIIAECRRHGIGFLSTAFDTDSFDMLIGFGLEQVKIPSGELTNLPLLRYMARLNKPVLLSTGMACLGEIEAAIDVIEVAGTPRDLITVLHCTTEYPTPMDEVNLRAMVNIGTALGVKVGYSDHSQGIEVAVAAVAMGASVIEKHFTLDRKLPGPDHQASLEFAEFSVMVEAIRNIEVALGDGIKRMTLSEARNKPIVRKSLVASRKIKAGEIFTVKNLTIKRPGTGISPMRWDDFLGKMALRDYEADELIDG